MLHESRGVTGGPGGRVSWSSMTASHLCAVCIRDERQRGHGVSRHDHAPLYTRVRGGRSLEY